MAPEDGDPAPNAASEPEDDSPGPSSSGVGRVRRDRRADRRVIRSTSAETHRRRLDSGPSTVARASGHGHSTRPIAASAVGSLPPLPEVAATHYRIDREIARGGMGKIVAAEDRRLGRPVALKAAARSGAASRSRGFSARR